MCQLCHDYRLTVQSMRFEYRVWDEVLRAVKIYGAVFWFVLTYLLTYLLTYFLTYSLTYLLTYSLTYSLYLLTYLLTPWSRVLLEKLTGFQLVKKFLAFYGNRRFITAIKSARNLSLSWVSSIQSIPPHPTSWRSILPRLLTFHVPHLMPLFHCWGRTKVSVQVRGFLYEHFVRICVFTMRSC